MLFRLPSEEELTDNKLNEFIAKHNAECAFRFKHLKDAYETDYQIFHQKPKPDYKPDNRIAVNFAKYMVDTFNGYFIILLHHCIYIDAISLLSYKSPLFIYTISGN